MRTVHYLSVPVVPVVGMTCRMSLWQLLLLHNSFRFEVNDNLPC